MERGGILIDDELYRNNRRACYLSDNRDISSDSHQSRVLSWRKMLVDLYAGRNSFRGIVADIRRSDSILAPWGDGIFILLEYIGTETAEGESQERMVPGRSRT